MQYCLQKKTTTHTHTLTLAIIAKVQLKINRNENKNPFVTASLGSVHVFSNPTELTEGSKTDGCPLCLLYELLIGLVYPNYNHTLVVQF